MGARGPLPDPVSGRSIQGRNTLNRQGTGKPPPGGKAECPDWLSPFAKEFWDQTAPCLEARGLLTALDQISFAALCVAWGDMREAHTLLEREGYIVTGKRGAMRPHPAVRMLHTAERQFLAMAKCFGMTPASRARLNLPAPPRDEPDPLERILAERE